MLPQLRGLWNLNTSDTEFCSEEAKQPGSAKLLARQGDAAGVVSTDSTPAWHPSELGQEGMHFSATGWVLSWMNEVG